MSKIIITTMEEIPENCCDCPCADHENGRCQADKEGRTTQIYRPFWCPLKEDKAQAYVVKTGLMNQMGIEGCMDLTTGR